MPAPATADEFLDLVQKSGVSDESRLKSYLQKLHDTGGIPDDPSKLAGFLVQNGHLTYFQADQLLQGKWKRFSIGKYKVLERLGAGGMGQVFLCEHKLMRRRVAVKVLPAAQAQNPAALERFYREARAVAALDHPNIVRAYDIDQDDQLHFLVMEYVDGTNLQDLVKKNGPLDFVRACHYVFGTAVGLQHAHEMGLVHRDIKPGNILVDRSGVVKILDMGLARFFNDDEESVTKKYDESILGTADYLSPEQALDSHSVDIRADLYSLGMTFYFLLTGQPPFPEGTVAQKLLWHQTRQPAPLRALRPDAPADLIEILGRLTEKSPDRRYQTPADLMSALAGWVQVPISPPDDRDLPQLSPAAMAGAAPSPKPPAPAISATGPGSNPPFVAGATPRPGGPPSSGSHLTTAVLGHGSAHRNPGSNSGTRQPTHSTPFPGGPIPTPPSNAVPLLAPAPQGGSVPASAFWDSVTADPRPSTPDKPTTPRPVGWSKSSFEPPPNPKKPWILIGLGGGVVLLLAAIAIAVAFSGGSKPPATDTDGRKWYVTKSGKSPDPDRTLQTLRGAIDQADAGDTIVLLDDQIDDPPLTVAGRRTKGSLRGVSFVAGSPSGTVTWTPKAGASRADVVLDLRETEDFRVTGIVIDAGDYFPIGIGASNSCGGLVLENVAVRNPKQIGFRFTTLQADPAKPVRLTKFRATGKSKIDAGVQVIGSIHPASRALVLDGGILSGPGIAGVSINPPSDLDARNLRISGFDAGVRIGGRAPPDIGFAVAFQHSTFFGMPGPAVALDAPLAGGKQTLSLTGNLFAQCKGGVLAYGPGVNGPVKSDGNVRDADTSEGRLEPKPPAVTATFPATDPDQWDRFLIPAGDVGKAGARP